MRPLDSLTYRTRYPPAMAQPPGDGELEDELWGNLRLRRSRSKSGYYGVTKVNSKKKPWQAWIKSATRKQQSLGTFKTAQLAAVEVAKALSQNEGEYLDSPRKQKARGALATHPCCPPLRLPSCAHTPDPTYRGTSACPHWDFDP